MGYAIDDPLYEIPPDTMLVFHVTVVDLVPGERPAASGLAAAPTAPRPSAPRAPAPAAPPPAAPPPAAAVVKPPAQNEFDEPAALDSSVVSADSAGTAPGSPNTTVSTSRGESKSPLGRSRKFPARVPELLLRDAPTREAGDQLDLELLAAVRAELGES
jgi:hypothetical protein